MQYKTDQVKKSYELIHPILKELCETVDKWSLAYDKKEITLTETVSTPEADKKLGRVSPAHTQGRAVDIRVKDWDTQKISVCVHYFNSKYGPLVGYVRLKSKQRVVMYLHGEGDNRHIHMAIGIDVIEKYKKSYPNWKAPVHTKKTTTNKEVQNG